MCGIFGIIKTKGPAVDAKQAAQWSRLVGSLAALSTSRGMDSTGIMDVSDGGTIEVLKDAVPAWELIAHEDWRSVTTPGAKTVATIGHTRFATHGAVSQSNAHPFAFSVGDDVTAGVHNGVINNHARLRVGEKVYAVDSANLIAALAGNKVRDWRSVLRRAEGTLAVAIVRVHDSKPTVFLTRRGNPLWVAPIAEFSAMAFASTKDILAGAIKLSRLTSFVTPVELDEGVLYLFKNGTGNLTAGQRWWKKSSGKKAKKEKGGKGKAERVSWGEEHFDGPKRAMGSNGREYAQCGSCLDWDQPKNMHVDGGIVLCPRCKIAADAWPRKKDRKKSHWDESRWGNGKATLIEADEADDEVIEEEIIVAGTDSAATIDANEPVDAAVKAVRDAVS